MDDLNSHVAAKPSPVALGLIAVSETTQGYLLLTFLSAVMATLGLIADSSPIIVGAMLVAPLLLPIMRLSLAALGGRKRLLMRAGFRLATGIAVAVATSVVLAVGARALPFGALLEIPGEVAARTHPNPFDLVVALAGGAAGAYAIIRLRGAAALFGVAIATAVMPPLCTIGIGIALQDREVWGGAALLFVTNLVAIAVAAMMVFAALGLGPRKSGTGSFSIVLGLSLVVGLASMLASFALAGQLKPPTPVQSPSAADIRRAVADVLNVDQPDAQLISLEESQEGSTLSLRLVIGVHQTPSGDLVVALEQGIGAELNEHVTADVLAVPLVTLLSPSPIPAPPSSASPTPSATASASA
jgi:uncharacterized hydrophobic protein (TIGR00271 family)